MNAKICFWAVVLLAGISTSPIREAHARFFVPAREKVQLPEIQVRDEADRPRALSAVLNEFPSKRGPVFLFPAYTRCNGTCPIGVRSLMKALSGYPPSAYRSVILSFDETDTAKDLEHFRSMEMLPATWKLVRGPDAAKTRGFLDGFAYRLMRTEAGIDHPGQVLVFNEDLQWVGSLSLQDLNPGAIQDAFARAKRKGFFAWIMRPSMWFALGIFGFAAAFGTALVFALKLAPASGPQSEASDQK